ncbi:MAG: PaaI family thioesterase [Gammaproteobacteria bacterium]
MKKLPTAAAVRQRALVALALNRTPGFHFAGNFLGVELPEIGREHARLTVTPPPFLQRADGQPHFGVIALLADMALACVVRANLTPSQRLGTVSLNLQLQHADGRGPLEAQSRFGGFIEGPGGRQGISSVALNAGSRSLLMGQGAFMVLRPPPGVAMHPITSAVHAGVEPLQENDLDPAERTTLARVDAVLTRLSATPGSFVDALWTPQARITNRGAEAVVDNGPEFSNRVGHVQGGLQLALAAATATAALPAGWILSGASAWYIRACEGRRLRITSQVIHRGRATAVVRSRIIGKGRRHMFEAVTTHVPGH